MRRLVTPLVVLSTFLFAGDSRAQSSPFARFERADLAKTFKESRALVIGNSAYANGWSKLPGVRDDVAQVTAALQRSGFTVEVKENLTGAGIEAALRAFLEQHGNFDDQDNRLLIYFAGHGYTMRPTYGGDPVGYIVGVDAADPAKDASAFNQGARDMRFMETYARQLQARHVLFMFDACFAGSIFGVSRGTENVVVNNQIKAPVRQFITSGSADEQVPDVSEFRRAFTRILDGEQHFDPNGDGFLTGSELGMFIENEVTRANASQRPQYGKLNSPAQLREGEFVFALKGGAQAAPVTVVVEETADAATAEGLLLNAEQLVANKSYANAEATLRLAIASANGILREEATLGLAKLYKLAALDAIEKGDVETAGNHLRSMLDANPYGTQLMHDVIAALNSHVEKGTTSSSFAHKWIGELAQTLLRLVPHDVTTLRVASSNAQHFAELIDDASKQEELRLLAKHLTARADTTTLDLIEAKASHRGRGAFVELYWQLQHPTTRDMILTLNLLGLDGRVVGSHEVEVVSWTRTKADDTYRSAQRQTVQVSGAVAGWSTALRFK